MNNFANLAAAERREIFDATRMRLGDNVAFTIAEKDFWVCWVLNLLFSLGKDHPRLVFKGGTSLSKAHKLIQRFSEDIDVVIATEFFLKRGLKDPGEAESRSEMNRRMAALDEACAAYIANRMLPDLKQLFLENLTNGEPWELTIDPEDKYQHTLLFRYPWSDRALQNKYIRGYVKIELGWRSADEPTVNVPITSYVAEIYPEIFTIPELRCDVLTAGRTFWEKITALHAESFRDTVPGSFSRHYYDAVALGKSEEGARALADLDMLEAVRRFKETYYYVAWARYDLAKPGTLKIVPESEAKRGALARDYTAMRDMFIKQPPGFDDILSALQEIQSKINSV